MSWLSKFKNKAVALLKAEAKARVLDEVDQMIGTVQTADPATAQAVAVRELRRFRDWVKRQ
jgi:hypothetical protein